MYQNITHTLPRVLNYEDADRLFTRTAKPRSARWAENQRPLKDTRSHHYRIEKYSGYYDVVLYQTVMGRFYEPLPDGRQRRLYRGHYSNTSQSFMSNVLYTGAYKSHITTEGKTVMAPVYNNCPFVDLGSSFSADFMFTKDNRLIVAESKHTPHYRFVSSAEDKEKRKRIKAQLANYVMLAVLRMQEYRDNVTISLDKGQPFSGFNGASVEERVSVEVLLHGEPEQRHIEKFLTDIAQEVFDVLASKRGYKQEGFKLPNFWSRNAGHKASAYEDLEKPITEKEFEQALFKRCLSLVRADKPSENQELPQFMPKEDYPRTNIHV